MQVNGMIYSRTKSVTRTIKVSIDRVLRAAQRVLGGCMSLLKQWLRSTRVDNEGQHSLFLCATLTSRQRGHTPFV